MFREFALDKPGIGDDPRGAPSEQRALNSEQFLVFALPTTKKRLPPRFVLRPARQPGRMHAVAGTICVALPHALERKQEVAMFLRPQPLQRIRKFPGRVTVH